MLNLSVAFARKNVTLIALSFFILLCIIQAGKPLHLDNVDFPSVGKATAISGLPIYYRGENSPAHSGLYHPPLYIYTLAAWYNLFGFSPTTTRMLGVLCAIMQGALALMIFRCLFGPEVKRQVAPFFWLLFLLNPYTLAISSIADIDSTIYGPILLAIIYSVLLCRWRDGTEIRDRIPARRIILTSLLFALGLWAKLTTILLLIPVIYLLLAVPGRWLSAARATAVMVASGTLIFLSTYGLYGWAFNLDIKYTFSFLLFSLTNRGATGGAGGISGRLQGSLNNLLFNVPFTLRWTGLLTWALILGLTGAFAYAAYRRKSLKLYHFLLLASLPLVNILYYWLQVMPFGYSPQKYHFVFWSLLHLPLAVLAAGIRPGELISSAKIDFVRDRAESLCLLAAFVLALVYGIAFVKDELILEQTSSLILSSSLFAPLLICLVVGLFLTVLKTRVKARAYQALVALVIICNAGLLTGIAWAQAKRPYTTTYNYGQRGITDAVAYLRSHTSKDDIISSMKDVGFMSERKYFENYGALFEKSASDELIKNLETGKIRYAVFTRGIGEDQLDAVPDLKVEVERTCQLVAQFGNYLIYEPNYWLSKRNCSE